MGHAEYSDAAYGQSIMQIASLDQADGGAVIAREICNFTAQWSCLRKIVFRKDGEIC
jgi:hypothetical protein